MKKEKKEDKNPFKFDFDVDIWWLERELEFCHQNETIKFRANEKESIPFGRIINSLFDIRKEELASLSINDGSLNVIVNEDEIWNYDFLKHYKRDSDGKYIYLDGLNNMSNQVLLSLAYRTFEKKDNDNDKSIGKHDGTLILHLETAGGIKDKTIYIQATFCQSIMRGERDKKELLAQPKALSILIAFDYRSSDETIAEFENVFNSALNKVHSHNPELLSYVEKNLLKKLHKDISKEFYFGKQVMSENRFWDAICYFENTFNGLQNKWWKNKPLNDEEVSILIECSFLIGYCYYELGLFDKSYKYLEFSATSSYKEYKYISEYINCLIALKDVRSSMIIDNHLEDLNKKNEEDRSEEDYGFYMFLLRRKAYCMIEYKQYDVAEDILQIILENNPENKFAKDEIRYINQLKNNE